MCVFEVALRCCVALCCLALFVCLFVCCVCLFICLRACLLFAWLFACLRVCLVACLLACSLVCLRVCLFVCVCLFVRLFLCLKLGNCRRDQLLGKDEVERANVHDSLRNIHKSHILHRGRTDRKNLRAVKYTAQSPSRATRRT